MKEICAVIRMNRINETKRALAEAGIPSVTARKVLGRGAGQVEYLIQSDAAMEFEEAQNTSERGAKLIPKRLLTIVVPDAAKDKVVQTVIRVNQTGRSGDGKIFVMPVLDACRVHTGEQGDTAIDEQT